MSIVITFSRTYPSYHPRAGEPTYFVEKILNSLGYTKSKSDLLPSVADIVNDFMLLDGEQKKWHTIRAGHRFKVGDKFSPRVWSGKPYRSKMIQFAPDIEVKKTWNIIIYEDGCISIDGVLYAYTSSIDPRNELAKNDGLDLDDFEGWFPGSFDGQIICWNEKIEY